MKSTKNKRKAIHAELRKESESFPGWLKYEVTVQNEDLSTERIPAYGKDLQDALSRVVHDEKVEKLSEKTSRIPWWVFVIVWFSYLFALISWYTATQNHLVIVGGIVLVVAAFSMLSVWSKEKNISR